MVIYVDSAEVRRLNLGLKKTENFILLNDCMYFCAKCLCKSLSEHVGYTMKSPGNLNPYLFIGISEKGITTIIFIILMRWILDSYHYLRIS